MIPAFREKPPFDRLASEDTSKGDTRTDVFDLWARALAESPK